MADEGILSQLLDRALNGPSIFSKPIDFGLLSPEDTRADGISELKRRMGGGRETWYKDRVTPSMTKTDMNNQMTYATSTSEAVPRYGLLAAPSTDAGTPEAAAAQDARDVAAHRMRNSQIPPEGRKDGPMLSAALMMYAIALGIAPEALLMRLAASAPAMSARGAANAGALGALGATAMPEAGNSGEDDFKWEDPNADRAREMADIQKRLNDRSAKITELGTTRTKSPPGTQATTIASLEKLNGTDTGRLEELRNQQSSDRGEALKLWQAKTQSEKPFRQENPATYRALPLAGWLASTLGGLAGARGGKPLASLLGGAAGGTVASGAAAVAPTAYDAATLPTGSKYQEQAVNWLRDPEYYKGRVVPEVLVGMLLGALGGKTGAQIGSLRKQSPKPQVQAEAQPPTAGLLSPEASVVSAATSRAPKGKQPAWMRGKGEAPQPDPFFGFER